MLKRYNLNYEDYRNNLRDNELIKKVRERDIQEFTTRLNQIFNFIIEDITNNYEFIGGFIEGIRKYFRQSQEETINSKITQLQSVLNLLINEQQQKAKDDLIRTGRSVINELIELYRKLISV
jgi:DNA-binding LacI/PurR family transcriptional regulator